MSFTSDLVAGFAQRIADAGIGVFQTSGSYQPSPLPVVFVREMADSPDKAIALMAYGGQVDPGTSSVTQPIQARIRMQSDIRAAEDVADQLIDVFAGASNLTLNGVPVSQIRLVSQFPPEQDEAKRWELTQNWYVDCARPTMWRND